MTNYDEKFEEVMKYINLEESDLKNFETFKNAIKDKDTEKKMTKLTEKLDSYNKDIVGGNNKGYSIKKRLEIRNSEKISELDKIIIDPSYEKNTVSRLNGYITLRKRVIERGELFSKYRKIPKEFRGRGGSVEETVALYYGG